MPAYKDETRNNWYCTFYFEDWNGERKKKMKRGFETKKAAQDWGADGIMTLATDMPMRAVAKACETLGLNGISYETAVKATDKGEMIKAFEAHGVAHPWYYVAPDPAGWPVQKGIWYAPGHDFYAFDIYVFTKDGGFFLPVMEANALFADAGLLYAWNRFIGLLDDCLAYPHVFPTAIPGELGLPAIDGNLCEGIVIKPLIPIYLPDDARVAVKVKRTTAT